MILVGDVLGKLAGLPSDHFDCVVTSPPYWGLRDYGAEGQIGLEPTMQEHIDKMVAVCAEIHRVLKPSGTFWLNYGDSYARAGASDGPQSKHPKNSYPAHAKEGSSDGFVGRAVRPGNRIGGDCLKEKDLCMIPNRIAIALQEWGWWVRSEIVWAKPNPMPESVTDRPATAHEKIWLLTKAPRYFYDNEAVRAPLATSEKDRLRAKVTGRGNTLASQAPIGGAQRNQSGGYPSDINGRNLRNYEPAPVQVWEMATRPFPGAHFATFPPELVERCLMAGTSQKGCCAECGAPWGRETETEKGDAENANRPKAKGQGGYGSTTSTLSLSGNGSKEWAARGSKTTTVGWSPSCACDAGVVPARVLDPFGGAGTVGLVADSMNLDWTLIELNPEYAAMAEARIKSRVAGRGTKERCDETAELFT